MKVYYGKLKILLTYSANHKNNTFYIFLIVLDPECRSGRFSLYPVLDPEPGSKNGGSGTLSKSGYFASLIMTKLVL